MPEPNPVPPSLAHIVASHIRRVLDYTGGNKTRAAAILGIDRRALYRKLECAERKEREKRSEHAGELNGAH